MNTRTYPLPAVVQDMLRRLNDSGADAVERDNTALMLEEIEREVRRQVGIYRRERTKQYREDREQKRRARSSHVRG